jgi:hypothetical protein
MRASPQPEGAMNKQFLLQLAGAQMQSAATVLKFQDPDNVGTDDVIANVLKVGGDAILQYSTGNVQGVNANLKIVADTINAYLNEAK